jgi:catechol 2,3-dioxygenase-like lactoylglutathione lyase family enzyme
MRVEGVMADGTCVSVNDTITIAADIFNRPDFEKEIVAYLNAGGSINGLPGALASTSPERAIRIQIVGEDITGNTIPDLFIGITLPYAEGDGETHLLFFTCVEGRYDEEVLFRRAGAGSRMEGLYAGGGVIVENVGDLNRNGRAEVFFSVNWPGYAEYFAVEWDGIQFVSLIEYENLLGDTCYWIEIFGEEVELVDLEGDGVHEIVVGEQGGEETVIWQWNGEHYSPDRK